MGRREIAVMGTVLHILAICLQYARRGSCLSEDLSQHREIETERCSQPKPFCQCRRIAVHHHVDEGFDFRCLSCRSDIAEVRAQLFQKRSRRLEDVLIPSTQEIERALARLCDTAGHAGFEGSATVSGYECLDFDMHTWRKSGAVYEEPVLGVAKKTFCAGR